MPLDATPLRKLHEFCNNELTGNDRSYIASVLTAEVAQLREDDELGDISKLVSYEKKIADIKQLRIHRANQIIRALHAQDKTELQRLMQADPTVTTDSALERYCSMFTTITGKQPAASEKAALKELADQDSRILARTRLAIQKLLPDIMQSDSAAGDQTTTAPTPADEPNTPQ